MKTQGHPPSVAPSSANKAPPDKAITFVIKWVGGILTLAASIVFGIWAPLSYKATITGNNSNDEVQSSLMSVMSNVGDMASTANSVASIALRTASAQKILHSVKCKAGLV